MQMQNRAKQSKSKEKMEKKRKQKKEEDDVIMMLCTFKRWNASGRGEVK